MLYKDNTRDIEVDGKIYTLTVKRSIVKKIAKICPELLKISNNNIEDSLINSDSEIIDNIFDKIYDNMPELFYELIKEKHNELTKSESDEIYNKFYNEYNDVDDNLLKFISSVFTEGIQNKQKKNLNW